MTSSTYLPIVGPGSQPGEDDGAELDYLSMPDAMQTYRMPELDQDLSAPEFAQINSVLQLLLAKMAAFPAKPDQSAIDLACLNAANSLLLNQILGEGEVSIVMSGDYTLHMQESVLAGVWRIQTTDPQQRIISDQLEVAAIPSALRLATFLQAQTAIAHDPSSAPAGLMNALPLITELNANMSTWQPGDASHVINLSLLPQSEQDLFYLNRLLGNGSVTVLSRGYGNCRMTSTATRHVWWVQYFNSQEALILNTLEICDVPEVACAALEDIADSHQRLQEIIAAYRE